MASRYVTWAWTMSPEVGISFVRTNIVFCVFEQPICPASQDCNMLQSLSHGYYGTKRYNCDDEIN